MNECWKRIIKKYADCYEAIQTLSTNGFFNDDEKAMYEHDLLFEIVETFKSEVQG